MSTTTTTIRVIDYIANGGGGVRFTSQLLPALMRQRAHVRFELVSHGPALKRYQDLLAAAGLSIRAIDIKPDATDWRFDVPESAFAGCDLAWLPWVHRHRVPQSCAKRVVGSFHDAILFQFADMFAPLLPAGAIEDERRTLRQWFASAADVVVSSNATVSTLGAILSVPNDRLGMIPLCGEHAAPSAKPARLPPEWTWVNEPFLLCPANISPHKNHELLLRGISQWGRKHPLALTGDATHLDKCRWSRAGEVKAVAEQCGFEMWRSLMPLGYVSEQTYDTLLSRAWALVMPTLAEGGGSFPVLEALGRGVPVVCSAIPVLREQMDRYRADVLWFDPHNPASLASALATLETDYPTRKTIAQKQVHTMTHRTWDEVASDYWRRFDDQIQTAARPLRAAV